MRGFVVCQVIAILKLYWGTIKQSENPRQILPVERFKII